MGGRGSSSGQRTTRTSWAASGGSMASGGRNVGPVTFQMATNPPNTANTVQQAQQANNATFADTDTQGYHNLYNGRQYYQNQNLTVSQQMAVMDYIDPDPLAGSLYGQSQTINHKLANGQTLNAQEQYVYNQMMSAMHNLGYNLNLTRYDHASMVNNLLRGTGLNMNTASVAQLKNTLVGMQFQDPKMLSTSYNDFKNAPSNNPFTDRQVRIVYRAAANTQALMTGDTRDRSGQKLSWGEIVVAPNMNQKIVGVREVSKTGARIQGTQNHSGRQIELIIELSQ